MHYSIILPLVLLVSFAPLHDVMIKAEFNNNIERVNEKVKKNIQNNNDIISFGIDNDFRVLNIKKDEENIDYKYTIRFNKSFLLKGKYPEKDFHYIKK